MTETTRSNILWTPGRKTPRKAMVKAIMVMGLPGLMVVEYLGSFRG